MHDLGLIGSRGLFGKEILKFYNPAHVYNSDNIDQLAQQKFKTVICAAPSANRRDAEANPVQDLASVDSIISVLSSQRIQRLVLIGTIDTIVHPDTAYGQNRLRLENFVKQEFKHHYVLRFGNIVGAGIKKNVLFDLKNNQFLDSINLDSITQWYPLNRLQADIELSLLHPNCEYNLISEPIQVREIVEKFFSNKIKQVGAIPGCPAKYNLTSCFSKESVFEQMFEYCQ
jgi:hypothetical protein